MDIQPVFDLTLNGSGSANAEFWKDLGLIPNGKKIFFGYSTFIAPDKNMQFEVRTNNAGLSVGTLIATTLQDYGAAAGGSSVDRDLFMGGNIQVLSVQSTGIEHWWLRVVAQSQSAGTFQYIFRYALL